MGPLQIKQKGKKQKGKKKILVIFGPGGHAVQALRLLDKIGARYTYEYVLTAYDNNSQTHIKHPGKIYRVNEVRTKTDRSLLKIILKFIPSTIQALKILLKSKPHAILSSGPAVCLHFMFIARLIGIKTIYLESWVRVRNPSITGRLVYSFTSLFFIQWPELKAKYPKAIYAGRLG